MLIRPDPSFSFNPSLSDSDEDAVDHDSATNGVKQQPQMYERLRGSESLACLSSNLETKSSCNWGSTTNVKVDTMLSSPSNIRRHTFGQQHFQEHQEQALRSEEIAFKHSR